jgi:hypothetical protein
MIFSRANPKNHKKKMTGDKLAVFFEFDGG